MVSRLLVTQKIKLRHLIVVLLPLLSGSQCSGNGSSGGGITIVQNDSTAPVLTIGAGQPGGGDVAVSAGESGKNLKLTRKTGALNLLATAKDPESGVQALEIWVSKKITTCDSSEKCTMANDSPPKPSFESTSPQKKPGETTVASSILADALDLSKEIPQKNVPAGNSLRVDIIVHAEAVNHLSGRTHTPEITATWSEP